MRDYGIVSPKFWIGETGKALRGNPNAQVLALYLMTSPHANMIGVFHCPVIYMVHETGIPLEGASKALVSLVEAKFCTYEADSETVFVHKMASYQIASELKPTDNRVKNVAKEWENITSDVLKTAFHAMYSVAFHMPPIGKKQKGLKSGFEAPTKPETETEAETEAENSFELFWNAYPKKVGKPAAETAFKRAKINGHLSEVIGDIESKSASDSWTKDGGQFIPNPSTYLNQRRWEDSVTRQPETAGFV